MDAKTYSFKQRLALHLGAPLIATVLRLLAFTWRVRVQAPPESLPLSSDGALVYGMWHEGILSMTGHWRDHPIQGLASQSFDGEVIARALLHLGFPPPARGSSSRGGAQALQTQLEALQSGRHVVITMDGPRGPRHQCKPGAVALAARSGRPLVPVVCAARPAFRLRSWDRTLIPPPFAKVVFVLAPPRRVAEAETGSQLEALPQEMEVLRQEAESLLG